ncbi:MAG TPA: DUF6779 domain-containing protein, partial [Blastococcus sp.]|nr:DUF6779 domain-containing protein [Blastococcus sp.]
MPLREDDVAPRTRVPDRRTLLQAGGFALAIAATLAVFLTDNPQVLRLAVVGVAWAFVLATVAAGRRSTDQVAARTREDELRRTYEQELDREVAARREYELELESGLRREAQNSMRAELDALHGDLAGLTELRDEVARVAELRTDIAALSALRDEVARVAALRDDVAELTTLRTEIGQLAELRDDMGRLRHELTEQLSSEMLIERIVMRTQASRLGADMTESPGRAIDAATRWAEEAPPRELTGGWPAVRLDEPRETRQFDQVRVERSARPPMPPAGPPVSRPVPSPSWRPSWEAEPEHTWAQPATASWEQPRPQERWSPSLEDRWATPAAPAEDAPLWSATTSGPREDVRHDAVPPAPPTTDFPMATPGAGSRAAVPPTTARPVTPPPVAPPEPLPTPLEWLAARSLIDAEPTSFRPEVPPRRRRGDEPPADLAAATTTQRPLVPNPPIRIDDRGGYRVA